MNYGEIYTGAFFDHADGIDEWRACKLKYGDAMAAIGYAFGVRSFEDVRTLVPFEGSGINAPEDGLHASDQVRRLQTAATRWPQNVLEIGCGRGEVAVSLAQHGILVQAVEPSPAARGWLDATARHYYGDVLDALPVKLINAPAHEVVDQIDWSKVDTVLMVESLEHILEADFEPIRVRMVEALRANRGRFIVTNWIDFHPIPVGCGAAEHIHCRHVDDRLYDRWCEEANVAFRQGAHLVLDY